MAGESAQERSVTLSDDRRTMGIDETVGALIASNNLIGEGRLEQLNSRQLQYTRGAPISSAPLGEHRKKISFK